MSHFFSTTNGNQRWIFLGTILLLFFGGEMVLPLKGWPQSFSDTGSFSFSGSHNPVINVQNTRKFLPGDGLRAGPVQFHPFLGVAEVYTDNVFRANKRRENDFLTTIAPGFQAFLPLGGQHSFLLDYRAAQFLYSKFSGNNAFTQNGEAHLTLASPGRFRVDVVNNFVSGFDRRGSELDSQQPDITKWTANTFRTTAQLVGNKIGIQGGVRYTTVDYRNNGQDRRRDRSNAAANIALLVPVSVATSAILGMVVSDQNFVRNNQLDSFSYGIFTGFKLAPSRQLSGGLDIGYNILNFDRAPETEPGRVQDLQRQGLSLGGKQQKALYIGGNLRWRPTSRLRLRFRPFRSIQQSAVINTTTFTQTGALVGVGQRFTNRIYGDVSALYSNSDFEEGRSDNRYRFRTGLDYRTVKWLGFRLAYIFERRFSSTTTFRFKSNTISFSVQAFL